MPEETVNPPQIENADIVNQENSQKSMTPGQASSREESQTLTHDGHPRADVPSVRPALEVTHGHDDAHGDTVVLPFIDQAITVPGGIYTVVFGALGVLTLVEVALGAALVDAGTIKVIVLLALAILKALLVVLFYMHLRTDNPIFRVVLGLPLLIVVLSLLYLVSVPMQGGLGYLPAP